MNYYSTRDSERKIAKTSAEVIKQGIAEDGGLFLPESIPEISLDFIKEIGALPYSERAAKMPPVWNQRTPSLPKSCSQSIMPGLSWETAVRPRSAHERAPRQP